MAESICPGCGLRFSGVTAFDRHQRTVDRPPHVVCVDPRKAGLTARVRRRAGRNRSVWGFPSNESAPWNEGPTDD